MSDAARDDPVFRNSRREAIATLIIWALFGIYTLGYCYSHGYDVDPGTLETHWGIPAWVFWGVIAPWCVANVVAGWFAFAFVKNDELGVDADADPPAESVDA